MKIHEMFGHQAERLQELMEFHELTAKLLQDLKDGKVALSQLTVKPNGWDVTPAPVLEVVEGTAS